MLRFPMQPSISEISKKSTFDQGTRYFEQDIKLLINISLPNENTCSVNMKEHDSSVVEGQYLNFEDCVSLVKPSSKLAEVVPRNHKKMFLLKSYSKHLMINILQQI